MTDSAKSLQALQAAAQKFLLQKRFLEAAALFASALHDKSICDTASVERSYVDCWSKWLQLLPWLKDRKYRNTPDQDATAKLLGLTPHCGRLCSILLRACPQQIAPSIVLFVCDAVIYGVIDSGNPSVVTNEMLKYGGFAALCEFAAKPPLDLATRRSDITLYWEDQVFRAIAHVMLKRSRRVTQAFVELSCCDQVLQRAASLYANARLLPVTREGVGLLFQHLALHGGPTCAALTDKVYQLQEAKMVGLFWSWMCPEMPEVCVTQHQNNRFQAAQILCNFASIRPEALARATNPTNAVLAAIRLMSDFPDRESVLQVVLHLLGLVSNADAVFAKVLSTFSIKLTLKSSSKAGAAVGKPVTVSALVWITAMTHHSSVASKFIVVFAINLLRTIVSQCGHVDGFRLVGEDEAQSVMNAADGLEDADGPEDATSRTAESDLANVAHETQTETGKLRIDDKTETAKQIENRKETSEPLRVKGNTETAEQVGVKNRTESAGQVGVKRMTETAAQVGVGDKTETAGKTTKQTAGQTTGQTAGPRAVETAAAYDLRDKSKVEPTTKSAEGKTERSHDQGERASSAPIGRGVVCDDSRLAQQAQRLAFLCGWCKAPTTPPQSKTVVYGDKDISGDFALEQLPGGFIPFHTIIRSVVSCSAAGCRQTSCTANLKQCGACHKTRYCSKQCQKDHWKAGHSLVCKS